MTLKQLVQDPSSFDFYQAVYSLERQFSRQQKRWQGVGRDGFPKQELLRFKSVQHLGFPGQPISKIEPRPPAETAPEQAEQQDAAVDAVTMHVSFLGLTGPSGVLPQHYSEMVLQRLKQRDKTMRDFFDLFNHRLISLYYRAWEKYRFACQYEMADTDADSFSAVLKNLCGAQSALGLYYAGAFAQHNRSAQQLTQILSELLGTKVELNPLQGRWLTLDIAEQSRLVMQFMPQGQHAALGRSAMLGSRVWDVSSAIELAVTVTGGKADALLPGSYQHQLISQVLADFLPAEHQVRVTLLGRFCDFPTAQLAKNRLCLGQRGSLAVRSDIEHQGTRLSYQLNRA